MTLIIQRTPRFDRVYRKLSTDQRADFIEAITLFQNDPFHPRLDTHKLHGVLKGLHAFSINYSDRVMFRFLGDQTAMLYDIGDHSIYN